MSRKIFFGGSFFPPHLGHTEMIQQALMRDPEAQLYLVPTKQNPLKSSPAADFQLIEAWLEDLADELSYKQFPRLTLETIEMTSEAEKSYSVDTLKNLANPGEAWTLLMGSDTALELAQWKNPQELLSLVRELWIVPRGETRMDDVLTVVRSLDKNIPVETLQAVKKISSTQLRARGEQLEQVWSDNLSPHVLQVWKTLK